MKKRMWVLLLSAFMLLSLAACSGVGDADDLSEGEYLPSYVPELDVVITDCLPAEQVSTIMGVEMTASDPYEDGTWVVYSSADGRQASVNMKNATAEAFDDMLSALNAPEAAPLIGERAYWYAETGEIIAYHDGYAISVSVIDPTVVSTKGLCEAITLKILMNLANAG